jgi:hypothetical protein
VFESDTDVFVEPICWPFELSTRRRSVNVDVTVEENATTIVFTLTPSVEPAESVNEPMRALFVPATIVWLP